jgi:siroheme decarboxylase
MPGRAGLSSELLWSRKTRCRMVAMQNLTELQKRLCNKLQRGLPICERPFARIADDLGTDEKIVLEQVARLKQAGVIRRLGAVINHRALGRTSTLVAANIPSDLLDDVVMAVNELEGVSHNYLRGCLSGLSQSEVPNLWFTLQGQDQQEIEIILEGLANRFGVKFYSLPAVRIFKLDVFFDLEERPGDNLQNDVSACNIERVVELDSTEKNILLRLQDELELISEPFALFCSGSLGHQQVLQIINELVCKGVIRRLSAVLDHRRLGFIVNVLFSCQVSPERVVGAGERLAGLRMVSHCYERKTFSGWPYNLYAMIHSQNIEEIRAVINEFVSAEELQSYMLLPSVTELKKQPVKQIL